VENYRDGPPAIKVPVSASSLLVYYPQYPKPPPRVKLKSISAGAEQLTWGDGISYDLVALGN
jgi:hypothetical protein